METPVALIVAVVAVVTSGAQHSTVQCMCEWSLTAAAFTVCQYSLLLTTFGTFLWYDFHAENNTTKST